MFTEYSPSPYKWLHARHERGVLRVQLASSTTGNALAAGMLDELLLLLREVEERPDVRVVVLSGAGRDFCAGADVREFRELLHGDPGGRSVRALVDKGRQVCEALEMSSAVTVARLHGRVVGAGLVLAISCDLRAAADTTRFRMPELALNLIPAWAGGLGRLIAVSGESRIRELMLTCAEFDARAARGLDLVQKVETYDDLDAAIEESWVAPLLRRPAEAVALTKRMFALQTRTSRAADIALLDSALLTAQLRR